MHCRQVYTMYTLQFPWLVTSMLMQPESMLQSTHACTPTNLLSYPASTAVSSQVVVVLTASNTTVVHNLAFFCNLLPMLGDMDLGQMVGVPYTNQQVGSKFIVPVRVNLGSRNLGAYDFTLSVDGSKLAFVSVAKRYSSGLLNQFVSGVGSDMKIQIAGTIDSKTFTGSQAYLLDIEFEAIGSGDLDLGGTINVLGEPDTGKPIGSPDGRAMVAGAGHMVVVAGRRRRNSVEVQPDWAQSPSWAHSPSIHHFVATAPQQLAGGPQNDLRNGSHLRWRRATGDGVLGDTNGDGKFNINDVGFIFTYLVRRSAGFSDTIGRGIVDLHLAQPWTLAQLDADLNEAITIRDADHLLDIHLSFFAFLSVRRAASITLGTTMPNPAQWPTLGCKEMSIRLFPH